MCTFATHPFFFHLTAFVCQTAIIATVAPGPNNAQESASTLKYAERAKSALNATQLSKTQASRVML